MVAAAILAMKMITRFRPRIFVMTGICAGFEDKAGYRRCIGGRPCLGLANGQEPQRGLPIRTRSGRHSNGNI
jgi:hypothetical protein